MNRDVILIGAGGHAKVCIEILQAMRETVAYCVGGTADTDTCLGVPVLKGDEHLESLRQKGFERLFVAIGSNRIRERLGIKCLDLGYELVNAISPAAVVSPSATFGAGVAVMAGAIINADVTVADFAIINTGATVDHDCQIGNAAHIAPQCALAGGVVIGNYSFLGVGCKVIPGIRIGESTTVGAGGVVINNIASKATAVGVPAKIIHQQDR